jgi:hypothetical protein
MQYSVPIGYFITFTTHGTWLHGDERGSVDDQHNTYGESSAPPNELRQGRNIEQLKSPKYLLSNEARLVVDAAMRETCTHRKWELRALNVRSNHVHVVIRGDIDPVKVMNDLEAWATRRLRADGLADNQKRVWTRRGSIRKLFTP